MGRKNLKSYLSPRDSIAMFCRYKCPICDARGSKRAVINCDAYDCPVRAYRTGLFKPVPQQVPETTKVKLINRLLKRRASLKAAENSVTRAVRQYEQAANHRMEAIKKAGFYSNSDFKAAVRAALQEALYTIGDSAATIATETALQTRSRHSARVDELTVKETEVVRASAERLNAAMQEREKRREAYEDLLGTCLSQIEAGVWGDVDLEDLPDDLKEAVEDAQNEYNQDPVEGCDEGPEDQGEA